MKKKNLFYLASAVVFVLLLAQTVLFNTKSSCVNGELPECVEKGQTCILNGTACCGSYTCKGKFPNTTCQ